MHSQRQELPPPQLAGRTRTRRRQQDSPNSNYNQPISNSADDLLFSLIDNKTKKFVPPPADSSSQFDTMTGEEIELHQTLNSPPTPRIQTNHRRKLSHYDYEVYFASRFAATSRNITIQNYFDDLVAISQDSRERQDLMKLIIQKVSATAGTRTRSQNEWRFFRDAILRRNFDEILFLSKRYAETSDLQLTRFFASEKTELTSVPLEYVDSLTLSGIKIPRIGDRTHIFTCHIIQTDIGNIWKRVSVMAQSCGEVQDLFAESVFNYAMNWILMFPSDFSRDFYKQFSQAIKTTINVSPNLKYALYFARAVARALSKKTITSDRLNELPRNSPLTHAQWGMPPLGVPPQYIAEHFMFVEAEMVAKLSIDDILSQRFLDIVTGFNSTCDYICRHILTDDPRNRARNISYWIDTMTFSAKIGNLFLVFEISAALNTPAISRLRRTWEAVSGELKDRFYSLDELTSPYDDYAAMRNFVSQRPKTECLPFVLAYARMSEQARAIDSGRGVDMMKMDVIGSLALQFREWGLRTYSVDNSVVDFVRSVKESKSPGFDLPIDVLSRKYEPPLSLPF